GVPPALPAGRDHVLVEFTVTSLKPARPSAMHWKGEKGRDRISSVSGGGVGIGDDEASDRARLFRRYITNEKALLSLPTRD
ncbi:hypothetical protein KI387_009120, partial [Taxus chinensis]